jgi:glyoxylase-like metal-dependent hydrolase (beta-lactamase superfamily II)
MLTFVPQKNSSDEFLFCAHLRYALPFPRLKIETFIVGSFPNNLYLLIDEVAHAFVVVDPSLESEPALQRAQQLVSEGFALQAIWNTHGHVDHVHDNALWKEYFPKTPIVMHEADDFLLDHLREQSIWLGLPPVDPVPADDRFFDGQTVQMGSLLAKVLHVPGHSPGSVAFYFECENVVLSGDVLFAGSIGRYDLPGADYKQLQQSLARLAALPPQTKVLSGHGAATTIGEEFESNPYLRNIPRS